MLTIHDNIYLKGSVHMKREMMPLLNQTQQDVSLFVIRCVIIIGYV